MRLRALPAVLLLPLLVACGSGGGAPVTLSALEIVSRSADRTVEAGSARMAMSVDSQQATMTSSGVFSLSELRGTMTMEMAVAGETISMEMRMLDGVLYLKQPAAMAGAGKPWLKVSIADLIESDDTAALAQLQQSDPTQTLAYLKGVSDDIREDGKEDVRGAATTRYKGTIDLDKARAAQTDVRAREALDALVDKLGGARLPVTVWIDAEGRMRKMVQTFDLAQISSGQAAGSMSTTVEMYDFGVPVEVEAPPASDVGDGSQLFGG